MPSRQRYEVYAERARRGLEEKAPEAIHARASEAANARAAHESYWLQKERERYGPVKLAKPLSRMPA